MTDALPGRAPRGRQAEAAANDVGILAAAFDLLTAEPRASMADIARRAGVGVASLYRRYPTRQALVHDLCLRAMSDIAATADRCAESLDEPATDPWSAFVTFVSDAVAAGAGAMRVLAGSFVAGPELATAAAAMNSSIRRVVDTLQADGVLRPDVTAADITVFFELVRAVRLGDRARSDQLRNRYVVLLTAAFRASTDVDPLPVPSPGWEEISAGWG